MEEIINGQLIGDISGTVFNSPALVPGMHGKALKFDGRNQWVNPQVRSHICSITIINVFMFHSKVLSSTLYLFKIIFFIFSASDLTNFNCIFSSSQFQPNKNCLPC